MGYMVSDALVLQNDAHAHLLFFKQASAMRYSWVNEWVFEHFSEIAAKLSERAALVVPIQTSAMQYNRSLDAILAQNVSREDAPVTGVLEEEFPFLVVTRKPVNVWDRNEERVLAAAINLSVCQDSNQLAVIFDALIAGAHDLDASTDLVDLVTSLSPDEPEKLNRWVSLMNDSVHLKPNIFGLGMNINGFIDAVRNLRLARRETGKATD